PALVWPQFDRVCDGWLGEARPSRAGFELGVRAEQLIPAAGAAVGAVVLGVDVFAGEGGLGVAAAQNVILLAGQFLPPLLIRLVDLGWRGGLYGLGAAHRSSPGVVFKVLNPPRPGWARSSRPVTPAGRRAEHAPGRAADQAAGPQPAVGITWSNKSHHPVIPAAERDSSTRRSRL